MNNMDSIDNTNKSKKINIDLIPMNKKLVLDLHGLSIDESRVTIDQECDIIKSNGLDSKRVIVVLHGYSKGEVLKKYIREEYKNSGIQQKEWGQNPGISYYILKEDKRK